MVDFEVASREFKEFWSENQILHNEAKDVFLSMIKTFLSSETILYTSVLGRVKDRDECISKFSRKYRQHLEEQGNDYVIKDYITDLIGLRIVCLYESDVQKIATVLEKGFKVIEITDKTSEMNKQENSFGYKGLHLDLCLNDERKEMPEYKRFSHLRFEVQIRTIIQDAWSVLDHKIKYKKSIPTSMKRKINVLAALFELADREFSSISLEAEQAVKAAVNEDTTQQIDNNMRLDVFKFLSIVKNHFSDYEFEDYKVDGFVDDILSWNPSLTMSTFSNMLSEENMELIQKYNDYLQNNKNSSFRNNSLNPYTQIRHIFYLSDSELYNRALYEMQRKNFDEWRNMPESDDLQESVH